MEVRKTPSTNNLFFHKPTGTDIITGSSAEEMNQETVSFGNPISIASSRNDEII